MNLTGKGIINFVDNIAYFINLYRKKMLILRFLVNLSNILFPSIALSLVIISTLNIAGSGYETAIKGDNYIILSALISSIIALLNSLISFFILKEKIHYYNRVHYQLIIELQKYELSGEKYSNIKDAKEKRKIFENQIFVIITGYSQENKEINNE